MTTYLKLQNHIKDFYLVEKINLAPSTKSIIKNFINLKEEELTTDNLETFIENLDHNINSFLDWKTGQNKPALEILKIAQNHLNDVQNQNKTDLLEDTVENLQDSLNNYVLSSEITNMLESYAKTSEIASSYTALASMSNYLLTSEIFSNPARPTINKGTSRELWKCSGTGAPNTGTTYTKYVDALQSTDPVMTKILQIWGCASFVGSYISNTNFVNGAIPDTAGSALALSSASVYFSYTNSGNCYSYPLGTSSAGIKDLGGLFALCIYAIDH